MTDCIFCKIIKSEIPSSKVYEDEHTLAFLDINPVTKGHTLVIPKQHCTDIFDMKEEDAKAVMATAKKVASAVFHGLNASGVNLLNSNKKAAGQEVFHYHMHIIPRYENDGVRMFPHEKYKETDFKMTAERIKSNL
ncbi:HIT family protein [Candidatus Micrarchaeota archaeon]|nr:HIT family protein [Candidatus Micrarchaeota archaeon]